MTLLQETMEELFLLITTTSVLLYLGIQGTLATQVEQPRVQKIRHIGLPTRGKYSVREETEKAPSHDHPCNLTRTAVKISFPEEMRSEIFVNLLGYKEPNLIHLQRCRGWCHHTDSSLSCRPTKVKEKKVKMTIRSFLTGKEPVDKRKELILDEHEECGCQCSPALASECSGLFNYLTCECECPAREFRERQAYCELRKDSFWDSKSCECKSKTIAARGVDLGDPVCEQMAERHLDLLNRFDSSDTRTVDMLAWVILGSSLTMVMALSITTCHYRNRVKKVERKFQPVNQEKYSFECKESSPSSADYSQPEGYTVIRKILHRQPGNSAVAQDMSLLEDGIILDREEEDRDRVGTMCEQYNEHGVQIENNCFD